MKDSLRLIVLSNCLELGKKVDFHLQKMRNAKKTFIVPIAETRFSNGEGKIKIEETIREKDVYILSDVGNYSCTYQMHGFTNHLGPDEHFQDIKRIFYAMRDHGERASVIMPLLYESRQHRRKGRESLDCANALQELIALKARNIITFDAHDPGIQNAIPNNSFENFYPTNSIIDEFIEQEKINLKDMLIVSPDTGAVDRARLYADFFNANVGIFYKRRDRTKIINGKNPVVEHKYIGEDVNGKNVIVVDDMIASGGSMLEVARELKQKGAAKIYLTATFSLFTEGTKEFDEAYQAGYFDKLYSTNLTYVPENIIEKEWFHQVDCSYQLAEIIDTLNRRETISNLLNGRKELVKRIEKKMNM